MPKIRKRFFYTDNVVAIGLQPNPGVNGYVKVLFEDQSQSKRPAEREDGSVDYREMKQLANVKTGQLIATRVPPLPGTAGIAVTGDPVAPKEGKEASFKVGKNVVVNPDKTAMYAAMDGLVTWTDKDKLNVFPVYEINGDVDYHTGNIDFVGTVVIRGNVLTGFRIRASGDIRVTGGVEGADLESDGSIEISGGIIGSGKGHVKAGVDVKCSFVQESNVTAGQDVIVSQSIMHSNIRAVRSIRCEGAKGLIVGGLLQAGDLVVARTIGNSMSTVTSIEVGLKPELRQELADLRQQVRQLSESLDKTEKALVLLDQLAAAGQLSADRLTMRIKLNSTRRLVTEELKVAKANILEIERTLEDTDQAKVNVLHTVFGGTKIVIGRYTRFVKDSAKRVTFRYDEGEIAMATLL
ncbi:FapA family protein [Cohnella ginsengisoli]|uniref:FapA family protein n=1 Tax=Cohnella ginsengisoli TaxID=425004 RepID=A0A9X4KLF9_9BACL|nr:FapA family protein [Cohnella ginsengisoli]MDG0793569.1 FapA family protein [Cohnella ginsengisoli]